MIVRPAKTIRSAHEILLPYFCFTGQSNRRALSRLALSGQLLSGAKRSSAPLECPVGSIGGTATKGASTLYSIRT